MVNVLADNVGNLEISFDGDSDEGATLVVVKGKDCSLLLEPLSGALRDQDLIILSASVDAHQALFRITDQQGDKVRLLFCKRTELSDLVGWKHIRRSFE